TGTAPEAAARQLEAARLAALAAKQRLAAAHARLALAGQEKALAEARLALQTEEIAQIDGDLTFPREVLDAELAELAEREAALERRITALNRAADVAEGALFEARRRLQRAANGADKALLEAQVAAREAELTAARRGADQLRQAIDDIATARTLWERRHALMQDADGEPPLADWLSETRALLDEIGERKDAVEAEIATRRSMQLALSRRLAETDLEPRLHQALEERRAALDAQQRRADELLVVQDELRSLAERLVDQLEPRVRQRSLGQHLEEAGVRLAAWWDTELFVLRDQGIYVRDLVTAVGVFALVMVAVSLLRALLRRTLLPRLTNDQGQERRTARAIVLALIRNTTQLFVVVVAFYAAMAASGLAEGQLESWLWTALVVVLWLQIGIWATAGAVDLVNRQRSRRELRDPSAVSGYGLILFFVRVGIWAVVLISVLTHFDYPVTGLIGALGVGGIAIAFAVQNILADVFNSMAIILDKPFRVGDFIVTGDTFGVVEQIGVKTTQIRSLSGEQVILSNTDILNSRIRNYKRMRERRVVFKLGVVYQTPPEKLERIPRIIETIIRGQPHARFDRAHFFEYGDFALTFEIVYYVLGADYGVYMDTQQAINLAIYRRFQEEGIDFAYPTQELILRHAPPAKALRPEA
ncbi:mechanosensitive ion channel domain-containing protein, partial [Thiococcus pfennigii]|uniref:mechanosensitive ion channel domain-containing protein n=1 Tax=Thiococcus pfennigii TaxID=1057 RepID=UPI0019035049